MWQQEHRERTDTDTDFHFDVFLNVCLSVMCRVQYFLCGLEFSKVDWHTFNSWSENMNETVRGREGERELFCDHSVFFSIIDWPQLNSSVTGLDWLVIRKQQCWPFIFNVTPCGPAAADGTIVGANIPADHLFIGFLFCTTRQRVCFKSGLAPSCLHWRGVAFVNHVSGRLDDQREGWSHETHLVLNHSASEAGLKGLGWLETLWDNVIRKILAQSDVTVECLLSNQNTLNNNVSIITEWKLTSVDSSCMC